MWKPFLLSSAAACWLPLVDLAAFEQPSPPAETVEASEVEGSPSAEEANRPAARPWLGVALKKVDGDLACYLGDGQGVLIDQVQPDSPAAQAGLKRGDLIVSVEGTQLSSPAELQRIMRSAEVGQPLQLTVRRHSGDLQLTVVPVPRPDHVSIELDLARELGQLGPFQFKIAPLGKEIEILLLGDPAITRSPDKPPRSCVLGDLNVQLRTELNGQQVELSIVRAQGQPAKITFERGDEVMTLTEDQLDQLPEQLRQWVETMLCPGSGDLEGLQELSRRGGLPEMLHGQVSQDSLKRLESMLDEWRSRYVGPWEAAAHKALERAQAELDRAKQWTDSDELKKYIEDLESRFAPRNGRTAPPADAEPVPPVEDSSQAGQQEQAPAPAAQLTESQQIAELKRLIEQLSKQVTELSERAARP